MKRKKFISSLAALGVSTLAMSNLSSLSALGQFQSRAKKMPVLFIGHGAPLYALGENKYNKAWRTLGERIERPNAVVCISAHWLTQGSTKVTAMANPRTIYDFGNFDARLFEMSYPAPGHPQLANDIANTIAQPKVQLDHEWGYDHGTWCVLYHMFPNADIPVLQLSIDYQQGAQYHFDLAKQLSFLRRKGVLIVCSGNIVHNLRLLKFNEGMAYDWAIEFDELSKKLIIQNQFDKLINYTTLGEAAKLSIPTPDHYYPLMYALGLKETDDEITFPIEGLSYASTSMRSVQIG